MASSLTLTFSLYFFLLFLIGNAYADSISNATTQTPPPPPTTPPPPPPSSAFKPGIAAVVGILTTMFSLTFLLLLYIKHCNSVGNVDGAGNISVNSTSRGVPLPPFSGRKNSGIDRSVIESLPIFRFGSLVGQKEGLDCAVCLNRFEASEVLRLLPKCKHAFHVECVDTWLDAHSTCPLCRYRVDPEDILLLQDTTKILTIPPPPSPSPSPTQSQENNEIAEIRRVSGRHSSVGEKEGGLLQIILQTPGSSECEKSRKTTSYRRSLDSATARKKNETVSVGVGCFVRPRKDGMLLLTQETEQRRERERERTSAEVERRLEHRIIVSPSTKSYGGIQRWSDVQPSDLLYLTSEMITKQQKNVHWKMMMVKNSKNQQEQQQQQNSNDEVEEGWDGSGVINSRSVSEITGLSRFLSNGNNDDDNREGRHQLGHGNRQEGLVSRWLAWISISKSQSQTLPAVR